MVVYLIQCKSCSKQYVGSTMTTFRTSFNNCYKSGTKIVSKVYSNKCNVYQEQFRPHFNSDVQNGMEARKITITDTAENVLELRLSEQD